MKKILLFTLVLIAAVSCSKDDDDNISVSTTEVKLNHGETYQIEATSESPILYESENEYHARVSETGLVSALFVGETNISLRNVDDHKTVHIVVEPTSDLYVEPDVEKGMTISEVKALYGTPARETTTSIGYMNYSKATLVFFMFDDDGGLSGYSLLFEPIYLTQLSTFLTERYKLIGSNDGVYSFINATTTQEASVLVALGVYNSSHYMVAYFYTTTASESSVKIKAARALIENVKILNE